MAPSRKTKMKASRMSRTFSAKMASNMTSVALADGNVSKPTIDDTLSRRLGNLTVKETQPTRPNNCLDCVRYRVKRKVELLENYLKELLEDVHGATMRLNEGMDAADKAVCRH